MRVGRRALTSFRSTSPVVVAQLRIGPRPFFHSSRAGRVVTKEEQEEGEENNEYFSYVHWRRWTVAY